MTEKQELPAGAYVVFTDDSGEVRVGCNGPLDPQEAALVFSVAQRKMELFTYRYAKQQAAEQATGIIKARPKAPFTAR